MGKSSATVIIFFGLSAACNSAVKNRRATCRISALNFPYEFDILIGLRRIQLYRTSKKHDVSWLVLTAIVFGSHSHSRRNRDSGLARPIKCIWNFGFRLTLHREQPAQPSRVSRDVARMAVVNSRSDTCGTRLSASCQSPEFASALDTSWAECIFFRAFGNGA